MATTKDPQNISVSVPMEELSPSGRETAHPGLTRHGGEGGGDVPNRHQHPLNNSEPAVTSNYIGRHNDTGDCNKRGGDGLGTDYEEVLLPLNPKAEKEKTSKMKQQPKSKSKSSKQSLDHEQEKLKLEEAPSKTPAAPPVNEEEMEAFRQKVLAAQKYKQTAVGEFVVHETLAPPDSKFFRLVDEAQNKVYSCWGRHQKMASRVVLVGLILAYLVYLGFAIHYSVRGSAALITITVLATFHLLRTRLLKRQCVRCQLWVTKMAARFSQGRAKQVMKWTALGSVAVGILVFLILDVGADRGRLTSAAGVLIFIFIGFITSKDPARIQWQPVLWGLGLQVTLGVIILRWSKGYLAFKFLGELVRGFLEYTDEGSKFVFGEQGLIQHPVAFKVFPIVIFFSSVIAIMYYWGIMQMIVCRIAWLMQFTMGTTAIESLNAATNIFIGMAESVVVVAPYMNKLTKSELHAVMTGGFATVAGSYMAVLIQVGASPEHLLSAAIMSAPAALAMAKLSYPETEVSITKTEEDVYIEKCQERNVVEAAARGAMGAIAVVASILVNLIAFIALMAFLDAILSYAGARVGYPELSFQVICSYILWPLAAIMGVEIEDAGKVARLLGVKVFVDEFISFRDLGYMVKAGTIANRSVVIATYACCGFGSVAAVGTYVGALAAVAPDRRGDISELAFRAAVNGNVAGFLTACIAGVLYKGDMMGGHALSGADFMMDTTNVSMTTSANYVTL